MMIATNVDLMASSGVALGMVAIAGRLLRGGLIADFAIRVAAVAVSDVMGARGRDYGLILGWVIQGRFRWKDCSKRCVRCCQGWMSCSGYSASCMI